MRAAIIPLALAACFEAAQGFSPAAVGLTRSSALPSARAMSGMRGGSGLVAAQMATAHDFKLPLVGGGEKSLGDYKGKLVLIENAASL
jgi:hypothetical protein